MLVVKMCYRGVPYLSVRDQLVALVLDSSILVPRTLGGKGEGMSSWVCVAHIGQLD